MVKVHGVASHARPFDVRTDALEGTVVTVQASCVPRVTVAHPETAAATAKNAAVTEAREKARFICYYSPLTLVPEQARP
jgi:hypothetical protein